MPAAKPCGKPVMSSLKPWTSDKVKSLATSHTAPAHPVNLEDLVNEYKSKGDTLNQLEAKVAELKVSLGISEITKARNALKKGIYLEWSKTPHLKFEGVDLEEFKPALDRTIERRAGKVKQLHALLRDKVQHLHEGDQIMLVEQILAVK